MEVKELLRTYAPQLGTRPEYFSGRGATLSDLNSDILSGLHKGILKEIGEEAANNFILFVANFDCLSATAFLNEFYLWHANGCTAIETGQTTDVDLGSDREVADIIGMATIGSKMFSSGRDDTNRIRSEFLQKHKQFLNENNDKLKADYNYVDAWTTGDWEYIQ